jgi:hypothetical protein
MARIRRDHDCQLRGDSVQGNRWTRVHHFDNGSKFISKAMDKLVYERGANSTSAGLAVRAQPSFPRHDLQRLIVNLFFCFKDASQNQ